ncbi:SGNH/GDSL hydrolase family protein [Candidatus Woesearchaeota archaeon]|nr:SGNH/GDSL hydrolase family protein [Candidatus Woesearchaeota archaeon]
MPKKSLRRKKNFKDLLINIAVFLIMFVVLLALLEVALWIIQPKSQHERQDEFVFYEYDSLLGWRNKPNASGIFEMPDSTSLVNINSKGLRDVEHHYEKPSGNIKRIEFFGDSFTWGYGVNASDRFVNVFANELQEKIPYEYEVINMGTTGYGTDEQYLYYITEGLKYNPDIVVFAYHNDVADVIRKDTCENSKYPNPYFVLDGKVIKLENVPVPICNSSWDSRLNVEKETRGWLWVVNGWLSHLRTYVLLRDNIGERILFINEAIYKARYPDYEQTLVIIDSLIKEADNTARKNNSTFVLVLLPDKSQIYGNANTIEIDSLERFANANNIPVINLYPYLRILAKKEKNIYFRIDRHFSVTGNKIVGEYIYQQMIDKGIIHG